MATISKRTGLRYVPKDDEFVDKNRHLTDVAIQFLGRRDNAGAIAQGAVLIIDDYTATAGDWGRLLSFQPPSNVTLTVTLPDKAPPAGWNLGVQDIGDGHVTIDPNGLKLDMEDDLSLSLSKKQGILIGTDGTNYFTERGLGAGASTSVFDYRVDSTNTSSTTDPGAGRYRYNNTTQTAATMLMMDVLTADDFDVLILFKQMHPPARFVIQDKDLSQHYQLWEMTGNAIEMPDWFKVPVTLVEALGWSGNYSNNTLVSFLIVAAGPAGAPGAPGSPGAAGPPGATGPAGVGVPPGGTTGQVLSKIDAVDYNTQWSTPTGGGGGAGSPAYISPLFTGPDISRTIVGATHGYATAALLVAVYDNATPRNAVQIGWTVHPSTFDVIITFATSQANYYVVINGATGPPGATGTTSVVIGFIMDSGETGTNVGSMLVAPRTSTVSKCVVVVKASDPVTALTFTIKQNGTAVFTSSPSIAAGASTGAVSTFTGLTSLPLPVTVNDVFSIDISSGSSAWKFTAQLV